MGSVIFDTHKVVKDLRDAGFDEAQAEAVVNALGSAIDRDVVKPEDLKEFATKADIAELRQDMTQAIGELRAEMKALELRMTVRTDWCYGRSGRTHRRRAQTLPVNARTPNVITAQAIVRPLSHGERGASGASGVCTGRGVCVLSLP